MMADGTMDRSPRFYKRYSLMKCPISNGMPTRISDAAFRSMCAKYREKLAKQKIMTKGIGMMFGKCGTCEGRVPAEITIINKGEVKAMTKKKIAQNDVGDGIVLKQLEKILGCGPGEDVLVLAENLKKELRIAKADCETKDAAGRNLMLEMQEARKIVLNGKKDDESTLTELLTGMVGAFCNEARDMRKTLGLPGNADWEAISKEVTRVRGIVDEYGELKQSFDALVAEKSDLEGELIRVQSARDDALDELENVRAEFSNQTVRLNSTIGLLSDLENQLAEKDGFTTRGNTTLTGFNPDTDALAAFGRAVLRGEVSLSFRQKT